jgi:hypothetical protein
MRGSSPFPVDIECQFFFPRPNIEMCGRSPWMARGSLRSNTNRLHTANLTSAELKLDRARLAGSDFLQRCRGPFARLSSVVLS